MTRIKNYYVILGVPEDAPVEAIREAYRRLAKAHHPDRAGSQATPTFQEISEAYGTLSDPQSREDHDSALRRSRTRSRPRPAGRSGGFRSPAERAEPLERRPWSGETRAPHFVIPVTSALAARGGVVHLNVPVRRACAACFGSMPWTARCVLCGGRGWLTEAQALAFDLPPGLRDRERLEYRVESGLRPAPTVTLLVRVHDG